MIRPTVPVDTPTLLVLARVTGVFKPMEIQALQEVLDDYLHHEHKEGHVSVTCEEEGEIIGFAHYAPASMTERSWYLYWIAVHKGTQARGVGRQIMSYLEDDIRRRQPGAVLLIHTSSEPHYD